MPFFMVLPLGEAPIGHSSHSGRNFQCTSYCYWMPEPAFGYKSRIWSGPSSAAVSPQKRLPYLYLDASVASYNEGTVVVVEARPGRTATVSAPLPGQVSSTGTGQSRGGWSR